MTDNNLIQEFNRQVENLLQKNYPEAAGMSVDSFKKLLEPLSEKIKAVHDFEVDFETGTLPFVIVIKKDVVDSEKAMERVERLGKKVLQSYFLMFRMISKQSKVLISPQRPSIF